MTTGEAENMMTNEELENSKKYGNLDIRKLF